jgi:universal stress protein A
VLVTRPGTPSSSWNRLLVALDGSSRGEQILADAEALARRLQSPIELLTAVLPPITAGGLGDVGGVQITEDPRPYLENLRKKLSSQGLSVSITVREGRAGAQILQRAEESAGTLLCMTSHGRTGLSRAVLGSIADEVIRHAPCPVLVRRSVPVEPAVR